MVRPSRINRHLLLPYLPCKDKHLIVGFEERGLGLRKLDRPISLMEEWLAWTV